MAASRKRQTAWYTYKIRKEWCNMPRITCSNIHCQYNKLKKCIKKNVKISNIGACTSYKVGFSYYFFYCAEHMQTNFLTSVDVKLHPEYKYSIYYMMRCLPVVYTIDYIRGMLIMCHKETKEILNANDLLALMETDLDKDALKNVLKSLMQTAYRNMKRRTSLKLKQKSLNRKNTAGYLRKVIFIRRNGDVMRWRHSGFAGSLV